MLIKIDYAFISIRYFSLHFCFRCRQHSFILRGRCRQGRLILLYFLLPSARACVAEGGEGLHMSSSFYHERSVSSLQPSYFRIIAISFHALFSFARLSALPTLIIFH